MIARHMLVSMANRIAGEIAVRATHLNVASSALSVTCISQKLLYYNGMYQIVVVAVDPTILWECRFDSSWIHHFVFVTSTDGSCRVRERFRQRRAYGCRAVADLAHNRFALSS